MNCVQIRMYVNQSMHDIFYLVSFSLSLIVFHCDLHEALVYMTCVTPHSISHLQRVHYMCGERALQLMDRSADRFWFGEVLKLCGVANWFVVLSMQWSPIADDHVRKEHKIHIHVMHELA